MAEKDIKQSSESKTSASKKQKSNPFKSVANKFITKSSGTEKAPKDGKLIPSVKGEQNASDFYMGHRIYTDVKHDFANFIKAAEERFMQPSNA